MNTQRQHWFSFGHLCLKLSTRVQVVRQVYVIWQRPFRKRDLSGARRVSTGAAATAGPAAGPEPAATRAGRRLPAHAAPANAVSTHSYYDTIYNYTM